MTNHISRRGFLAVTAAMAAATTLPVQILAQSSALRLTAGTRTIDVDGRAATVFGLLNERGGHGLILEPGQRFEVALRNDLDVDTIIHWHGQIPPNDQDGVPHMPMPVLAPGETRHYDFDPLAGTHWMHSHIPVQEMQLLAAPLIVRRPEDVAADRQDVVMFLHDFSFKSPEEVLAEIASGEGHGGMDHGSMGHGGMDHGAAQPMAGMNHSGMGGMAMDLNDFDFDAYLTNDRTLSDPEVVRVERGGRVKLRIINASAATTYWIDTGIEGRLVAVDGHPVEPVGGKRFGLSMGQRLDIDLDLPAEYRAFPVFALREGEKERTGLILAPAGATISRLAAIGEEAAPPFDINLAQEGALRALDPLPSRDASKSRAVLLDGSMSPYVWTIDGRTWDDHLPIVARSGERVEMTFRNRSMMGHPMHLHGHSFQVVAIGNRRFTGAVRDTVHVPPMTSLTIALDAGEAANWMLHCHHMPHLSFGMMTEFQVQA
ncbi:multicopper oxidase family protein [Pelagibacterium lentulum]|uniref:Multicopper oxidase n=1 Tax=Pelagibacterium lentulum TaxID=2029865 RepID=A0A916R7L6_9HYPH|nr:multicopper oxidase domain-containing protein [Pelagibacterium lentulum]GGA43436.1 multicopper oxidase [Pelagibacterium lentulum]